jgi:DNA-binding LacI/PurR family transcriptional regulator
MDGTRETAFADPPLTAVEIPWYDMLALGARLLLDLIEHRPPIEQIGICYATRLIVRESTRPPSGVGRRRGRQNVFQSFGAIAPEREDG